jgi:hypothetical protein
MEKRRSPKRNCTYIHACIHINVHTHTQDLDKDGDEEITEEELYERLLEKNVRLDDIKFIFKRYAYCTRTRDPPAPEPEVNDMVRELYRLVKNIQDSQAVSQRKLDSLIAGQDM